MKKLCLVILVLMLTIASSGKAEATKVKFSLNISKDLEANILSPENVHGLYSLGVKGILFVTNRQNDLPGRSVEIILSGALANWLHFAGHEGGHTFAARKNGAYRTKLFNNGVATYWGYMSEASRRRVSTAGLDWANVSADEVVSRNVGKKVSAGKLIWFGVNQLNAPTYVFFHTKRPKDCLGECKNSTKDPVKWFGIVGNSNLHTMNKLHYDLQIGAVWQSLGLALPLYKGVKYWWTGEEPTIPNFWVNPQFDMTDAGVMYALGVWYRAKNGMILRARPGFGKKRVGGGNMAALEIEISEIRLGHKIKGGLRLGVSKTLESSYFVGASLERSVNKRFSIGISGDFYDGYHRKNPKAEGSWIEGSLFLRINL